MDADSDSLSFNQIQDSSDDLGALEDTDVCVVCCESLEDSLLLNCLHSICKSCATSQTTEQIRCPRCRATSSCRLLTKDFLHSSDPPKPLQWEDQTMVSEITSLINDGKSRMQICNEDVNQLNNNLEAIHDDRVKIKQKIDESFELYKSILEDIREEFLIQLENSHNDRELITMDRIQDLELGKGNLDHTVEYVTKIMKDFPDTEALNVLPLAKEQLTKNLRHLESLCKADKPSSLYFTPHPKQFRKAVRENFGSFTDGSSSVYTSHSLVIPEIAQRDVLDDDEENFSKGMMHLPREKKMSTCSDLLSPMVPDQGFVSPGEHLLSPCPPGDGDRSNFLASPMLGSDVNPLFVNPPSLQVPQFGNHPIMGGMQNQMPCRPALPARPDTGGGTRTSSQLLTGSDISSAHLGYPGRRMGTSHPDLYRGHTPPPFGRGYTPPLPSGGRGLTPPPLTLGGRGVTPPLLGSDMMTTSQYQRTDYSLAQLAEKLQERSNSGPTPGITLADLLHASEGQPKEWEDPNNANPSQAFTNIAALAQLDEIQQDKKGRGGWDHNLLMPEMDRSRSVSAMGNSGQLSPVPPMSPLLGVPGHHDPRGASPISPIDSLMPSMSGMSLSPVPPFRPSRAINPMQVRCKFGTLGPGQFQFNAPHGFCLGIDEEIVVADTHNHRIVIYEKNGQYKNKFGVPGKDEGQLWYPRKVAVIKSSGKFVICDRGNERSRMQIFTKHGHWVRKIAIRYIDIVAGLAITKNDDIVAVDSVTPTIFVISETGKLVRWFDCADHMREPSDIAVSGSEFFVCDFKGHNVVVFNEEGNFMRRIGYEKITNFPNGIDVSDHGDVLIGDSHGNRFHVAVFGTDGNLLAEFECPYVKVSRCCGLKLTSEGYVVTLAKNNHHVLVLNTLFIN